MSHLILTFVSSSYYTHPTRVRDSSKTLIDNIFSIHNISKLPISIKVTATISGHLPEFIVLPNIFCTPPPNKSNIYERDWSAILSKKTL